MFEITNFDMSCCYGLEIFMFKFWWSDIKNIHEEYAEIQERKGNRG
jgi:hypothetical protein